MPSTINNVFLSFVVYLDNIYCKEDSLVVLHAFEIPPLPYSSGPCKLHVINGKYLNISQLRLPNCYFDFGLEGSALLRSESHWLQPWPQHHVVI